MCKRLLKILFTFIETFEREYPRIFWLLISCFGFLILPSNLETNVLTKSQQSPSVIKKGVSAVFSIDNGGANEVGKKNII